MNEFEKLREGRQVNLKAMDVRFEFEDDRKVGGVKIQI